MIRALVTGASGQDGHYLAGLLLASGYEVHGTVRPGGDVPAGVIPHAIDLAAPGAGALLSLIEPDHVYNLAAVSSVFRSWKEPELTARVNGMLPAELLAAIQRSGRSVRFVQASSAEIFGMPTHSPQNEETPVRPTSPYGAAKAYAHGLVDAYRQAGVHASSLILYNHESPLRPETFVTRKITAAAARIALGRQEGRLELGNLAARRDWGWAPDYADALHRAALAEVPGDYVIATGQSHSVEDFVRAAFEHAGVGGWRERIDVSDDLLRAGDAAEHLGDASKARQGLGWGPTLGFEGIVARMVDADLTLLAN
jgi:GDPmannose 4,6-dehydratase